MKPIDRFNKARIAIMRHPRFCRYSGIMACGDTKLTTDVPTACTDGWNTYFNPEFFADFTDSQLRMLILHEQQHKAYRHNVVWRSLWKKDPQLANIAADHFVNLSLIDMDAGEGFVTMPNVGVQPDPQYRGWSVGRIYHHLKQDPPPEGSGGMDDHDWEPSSDPANPDEASEAQRALDQARAQQIDQALRQGEILAKRRAAALGLDNELGFGELLHPMVDWRTALREFVTEHCAGKDESSWRRPNRRYLADDVYMPSMQGITMTRLAVVMDTSGSCFGTDIATRFVSELAAIAEQVKPTLIDILYVDTEVAMHQTFDHGQFAVAQLRPRGGGGTNLPVAFGYLSDKRIEPTAMVVLTDGETPFGNPPAYPVLWAMSSNVRAPYGTTVYLGD
jgi:predicted metal-dependent peptidase